MAVNPVEPGITWSRKATGNVGETVSFFLSQGESLGCDFWVKYGSPDVFKHTLCSLLFDRNHPLGLICTLWCLCTVSVVPIHESWGCFHCQMSTWERSAKDHINAGCAEDSNQLLLQFPSVMCAPWKGWIAWEFLVLVWLVICWSPAVLFVCPFLKGQQQLPSAYGWKWFVAVLTAGGKLLGLWMLLFVWSIISHGIFWILSLFSTSSDTNTLFCEKAQCQMDDFCS